MTVHGDERAERMTTWPAWSWSSIPRRLGFPRSRRGGPPLAFLPPTSAAFAAA